MGDRGVELRAGKSKLVAQSNTGRKHEERERERAERERKGVANCNG